MMKGQSVIHMGRNEIACYSMLKKLMPSKLNTQMKGQSTFRIRIVEQP